MDCVLARFNFLMLCYPCNQVNQSDGGVSLAKEEHKEVAEVAQELQKYCVEAPVKCPLIFGGTIRLHSYTSLYLSVLPIIN